MASQNPKKRKSESSTARTDDDKVYTSKPTAVFAPSSGRHYTLSVALPGSIIANAQNRLLKTILAGQIARALAVFCVDEVVIFDDGQAVGQNEGTGRGTGQPGDRSSNGGYNGDLDPNKFLAHLLSYLETPPHLRTYLFPLHPDLQKAGMLPSLDMPHHVRSHEWCRYREGVALPQDAGSGSAGHKRARSRSGPDAGAKATTLVYTGLSSPVSVPTPAVIPPNTRLTVKFASPTAPRDFETSRLAAEAVAPSAPREEGGYFWGYEVRRASSLSVVLTECPFDGGYDLTIGTSERGISLDSLVGDGGSSMPEFRHMLLVFGGVAGLEPAVEADSELSGMGVGPEKLFDHWVNLCPGQGSRTIRTEEALWLGLMGLREIVLSKGVKS